MAGGQRRLEVLLELRDRFSAGIKTAAGETEGFLSALKKATPALLAISGAATAVGGAALKFGSDLEQARGRAVSTFGDAASIIQDFANTSAESFGLSQRAASEYAASMGNILNASGLARDASATASVEIVKLASNLAAFNNIPVDEALGKLQAGLTGAERPLRELGIFMSEDAVQAAALRLGIAHTGDELTEAQKIQARYAILVAEGSKAHGAFAESSKTVAAQMQIARAQLEDTAASLGTALLPATSKALQAINVLIKGFADLPQGVQLAGVSILGAAGALAALGVIIPRIVEGVRLLARVINTELITAFVRLLAPVAAVAATFMVAKSTGEALLNALDNLLLGTNKETDAWKLMQRDISFLDDKLQDLVGSVFKSVSASGEATQATSELSDGYKKLLGDLSGVTGGLKTVAGATQESMNLFPNYIAMLEEMQGHFVKTSEAVGGAGGFVPALDAMNELVFSSGAVWDESARHAVEFRRAVIEAGVEVTGFAVGLLMEEEAARRAKESIDALARASSNTTPTAAGITNVKLPGGQTVGGFATAPFPWEFRAVAPPGAIIGPPPGGTDSGIGGGQPVIVFNAPVYGMDDFADRVNQAVLAGRRRGVR